MLAGLIGPKSALIFGGILVGLLVVLILGGCVGMLIRPPIQTTGWSRHCAMMLGAELGQWKDDKAFDEFCC